MDHDEAGAEVIDLAALQGSCPHEVTGDACYRSFAEVGLALGPAFRAVQQLHARTETEGGALAVGTLRLHDSVMDTRDRYVLHPGLMDGALQTSIGLELAAKAADKGLDKRSVPFALESMALFAAVPDDAVSVVRRSPDSPIPFSV